MSTDRAEIEPTRWNGDMCFGIISTKAHTTLLTASPDGLILEGPLGKKFHLPSSRVTNIETGKSSVWFLSGLRTGCIQINHTLDDVPKPLLFSAKDAPATDIAQELKKLGYDLAQ